MNIRFLKFIIFSLSLFFVNRSAAQSSITFDAGEVFSTFKFTDDQGNKEKNLTHTISGSFSLGYKYELTNGLFIRTSLGMRKAGASLVVDEININWNIQYADANLGLGYMLNKWRLKPYFSASPYFGYMLKGYQTIGSDNYDILKNNSIANTDFGFLISPGFKIALSNSVSFYTEYKYILGLQNLEKSDQKSFNRGFSINLGVAVTIIKYNYVTSK